MNAIRFDWDNNKAASNLVKHKISFEEENIIRLISARKATKTESKIYKEHLS